MESESMVEKGINFIFCLGTAYDISSMESVGMFQVVFVGGMDTPPKMFLSLCFSLWDLEPLQIPISLHEGPFFYFMQFLLRVSIFSHKKHQLGGNMIVLKY